jgi:hypothetical protein
MVLRILDKLNLVIPVLGFEALSYFSRIAMQKWLICPQLLVKTQSKFLTNSFEKKIYSILLNLLFVIIFQYKN